VNSSQLDTISVKTSDNVTLGYSVAGLGSRLVAQILDNLLAVPLTLVALLLYGAVASVFVTGSEGAGFADAGAAFFAAFVYFGYFFVAEAVTGGKTPGKSAMGLRVIRVDGSAADFGALAVRNVIRVVDVGVVLIGIVIMFFQPQTRRGRDTAADHPTDPRCRTADRRARPHRWLRARRAPCLSLAAGPHAEAPCRSRRRHREAPARPSRAAAWGTGAPLAARALHRAHLPATRSAVPVSLDAFIAERQGRWGALEAAIKSAKRGRLRNQPASEIEHFGLLLRQTSSDLAIARRDYPDAPITEYLNTLCARAHPLLYRGRAWRIGAIAPFFATALPRSFRAAWPYIVASLALVVVGFIAGWLAVDLRPDLRASLVPPSLFDEMARGQIGTGVQDAPFAAAFIIQNNIRVALICFAGGILLGIPTALVLLSNGWMLGTVAAAVQLGGYNYQFWSLIVPHGILELSVIVISGGTGLMLGDAILRPGQLRRGEALARVAVRAVMLVLGAASLLIIAGTLEAFVSPSSLPDGVKLAIGGTVGVLLYSWLLLAGRQPRGQRRAPRFDRPAETPA
jgi:uncharacterized membrane protein SpoIIM required for sporulation/uncharacterized RDD family membrane protein YckC